MMKESKAEGLLRAFYGKRIAAAAAGQATLIGSGRRDGSRSGRVPGERPWPSLLAAAACLAIIGGAATLERTIQAEAPAPGLEALMELPPDGDPFDALLEGFGFVSVESTNEGVTP